MKATKTQGLAAVLLTLLCILWGAVTVSAADITGNLDTIDGAHITGWAWKNGAHNEFIGVELYIYKDGSPTAKIVTVTADQYSESLQGRIGDGQHAFDCVVDWSELGGVSYKIEAYAVYGEQKILLPGSKEYTPGSGAAATVDPKSDSRKDTKTAVAAQASGQQGQGPGVQSPVPAPSENAGKKGRSLGMFTTTGYCCCDQCSSGSGLTYSGTTPQPNHTISADISIFPIGTKLMIGDVVYTVEDIGSSVNGNKLDIFYATHEEALAHGVKSQEVFEVAE